MKEQGSAKALLVLEDGTVFEGESLGATGTAGGEVVFNTSMTGYQEVLTDPSYRGQIVTMTYPLIGNYGLNGEDSESSRPQVAGLIVRQACKTPSNWRAESDLPQMLARQGVVGIEGVDTRALTRHLRSNGTMRGVISTDTDDPKALARVARDMPDLSTVDVVREVTTTHRVTMGSGGSGPHVVILDLGTKMQIARELAALGCRITIVPAWTTAAEILALTPDVQAVVLSNGPGDPARADYAIATAKALIASRRVPLLGICLGHQILGLALGARTFKLKFGHRGGNHPVKDLATGKVYITSQNHGFALDEASLPQTMAVTHRNLNDGTVEGFCCRRDAQNEGPPVWGLQYHPEAAPGPTDSRHLFMEFIAHATHVRW